MSIPELEKRIIIAESKIDKLEQLLIDNIVLIKFLNEKYSKFIPKYRGVIRGIETQRHIEQLNKNKQIL